MNLLLWGLTLGTIGKLVLGIAVLRVHLHMFQARDIDDNVLAAIKREHIVTIIGLALIVLGYLLEVMFYYGYTDLLECFGSNCGALLLKSTLIP